MNRSPSRKPAVPPINSFVLPERKTASDIAAQSESVQKVDGVSETPLRKALVAAGKASPDAGKAKGRAKVKKSPDAAAPPAEEVKKIVYPWQREGLDGKEVFSTRLPNRLQIKMKFLAGLTETKIGDFTAQVLEKAVNDILKQNGIEG